ncbi:hypothetical protein CIB84_016120 [Bambusicola thoracicus]|uniref:Uncharacterized protein n=1 Tax=Bambusicola thoracicus TaxID=9083 RepID=A0A2P4S7P7_BAMTH|nr:hypothetical protein CIB84_016120 [Bambusicola thoracicus]
MMVPVIYQQWNIIIQQLINGQLCHLV